MYDKEVVEWWNKALQHTQILSGDWKDCVSYVVDKEDNFTFLDPPYRGSFTSYGQEFGDDKQNELISYVQGQKQSTVFLCNRDINDGFYDDINLKIDKFDITYTAGRRKKTEDGFEAKPAIELLIRN